MLRVASLTVEERDELRHKDAVRTVAESGHPGVSPDLCIQHIQAYGAYLEYLHEKYELDEDEVYTFDIARGVIFEGTD